MVIVGVVVLLTFAICWLPFLRSVDDTLAVVQRLFPFSRGVFEVLLLTIRFRNRMCNHVTAVVKSMFQDKVSNFWCTVNVVLKIKNLIPQPRLVSVW